MEKKPELLSLMQFSQFVIAISHGVLGIAAMHQGISHTYAIKILFAFLIMLTSAIAIISIVSIKKVNKIGWTTSIISFSFSILFTLIFKISENIFKGKLKDFHEIKSDFFEHPILITMWIVGVISLLISFILSKEVKIYFKIIHTQDALDKTSKFKLKNLVWILPLFYFLTGLFDMFLLQRYFYKSNKVVKQRVEPLIGSWVTVDPLINKNGVKEKFWIHFNHLGMPGEVSYTHPNNIHEDGGIIVDFIDNEILVGEFKYDKSYNVYYTLTIEYLEDKDHIMINGYLYEKN